MFNIFPNQHKKKLLIDKDKDDIKFKPGLKKMNSEFIKTILNKRNNLPNLGDALKTAKLINLIY